MRLYQYMHQLKRVIRYGISILSLLNVLNTNHVLNRFRRGSAGAGRLSASNRSFPVIQICSDLSDSRTFGIKLVIKLVRRG